MTNLSRCTLAIEQEVTAIPSALLEGAAKTLLMDDPWDGRGVIRAPADDVIAPVFTLWLTLMAIVVANPVAERIAAADMQVRFGCKSAENAPRHCVHNILLLATLVPFNRPR